MAIKVFITGGTIDGLEYDSIKKAPKRHRSIIPALLKNARLVLPCSVEVLLQIDSKFVTDSDRAIIYNKCRKCPEDKIVITHGTMSMQLTAKFLGKKRIPKTIVLLGAAIPAKKKNSDAFFNLGFALAAVQLLPHGVYVAMNGKIFSWNNVRKNLKIGRFETIR